jgi:hypothetical protein
MSDLLWAVIIICSAPAWVPVAFIIGLLALAVITAPIALFTLLVTALIERFIEKHNRKSNPVP